MSDCTECVAYESSLHQAFPAHSRKCPQKKNKFLTEVRHQQQELQVAQKKKQTVECAHSTALRSLIYLEISFQQSFNMSLKETWAAEPSSGLQLTPTRAQVRQSRRETETKVKERRTLELKQGDFNNFFGSTMSQAQYERNRLNECMGNKEKAEKRMRERLQGERNSRKVSLICQRMTWNCQGLVEEARQWKDGQTVIWSAVAHFCGILDTCNSLHQAKNGGQLA